MGDSLRWSVKESTHREHLILARIKGELHPCAGAPTRTNGEWRLSDTSVKHRRVPSSLFTLSIYFVQFNSCLYILRVGLKLRLQVFYAVEQLETLSRHKELIGLTIGFNYCKEI